MSLQYVQGDLFAAQVQTIVIPVNCRGVAGKGLALQCRQRYPQWFQNYQDICCDHLIWPGQPVLHASSYAPYWIVDFPTKGDWRLPSSLLYIETGLSNLFSLCYNHSIASLALPKLGCGAGGLSWEQVQPLIETYLSHLPLPVYVYV
jgi:O-acetyl-ADP-ribose deacetylase (regulator of RNase III)